MGEVTGKFTNYPCPYPVYVNIVDDSLDVFYDVPSIAVSGDPARGPHEHL